MRWLSPVYQARAGATSSWSLCYNSHLLEIVYGVMPAPPSHELPFLGRMRLSVDKPNACNQCHFDWSVNRANAASGPRRGCGKRASD